MSSSMEAPVGPARDTGYTTDLRYPSSFVFGQTPVQLVWAAAAAGFATRSLAEPYSYCDLGCGDGITLNVLADEYPRASFVGIDLNAEHLRVARAVAEQGGLGNVSYVQSEFAELAAVELPEFDFIAVHGVYSWVDDEVRDAIHAFVRSRLKPGGLTCVQYSCLPGATVHDPLLNALRALSERVPRASAERVQTGIESLRRLAPWSRFFEANPQAGELLRHMTDDTLGSLAHDVLNRRLHSFYFHEVRESFASLGLRFVGSSNLKLNHAELMMPAGAHAVYRELTDSAPEDLRQELLDLIVNTASRCDVFRKPVAGEPEEDGFWSLGGLCLQPIAAAASDEARRRLAQGTAVDLNSPLHLGVLAAVGSGEATIRDVLDAPALGRYAEGDVERAIAQLYMMRCIDVLIERPRPAAYDSGRTYRLASVLNRRLLEQTMLVPEPIAFASPVLGTALRIPADARLRLLAFTGGDLEPVWNALRRERRRIVDSQGSPLGSFAAFCAELAASLPAFATSAVPELLRFGVLEPAD